MSDETMTSPTAHQWYSRPVLFVADLQRTLHFYVDLLGFVKQWHEGDGTGTVAQVHRAGCEIILCESPTRKDTGRLFIELTRDGLAELRNELTRGAVPSRIAWWGSDVVQVDDPDGNELLFPVTE
jgi:catechol 2,3-dioxygenase-like lactoylglutathione lyase family enzyme